jgi:hypothetical protein
VEGREEEVGAEDEEDEEAGDLGRLNMEVVRCLP